MRDTKIAELEKIILQTYVENLTEEQRKALRKLLGVSNMKERDSIDMDKESEFWRYIKRVIYFEAKKYVSKEVAENIARNSIDYLIANGVLSKRDK